MAGRRALPAARRPEVPGASEARRSAEAVADASEARWRGPPGRLGEAWRASPSRSRSGPPRRGRLPGAPAWVSASRRSPLGGRRPDAKVTDTPSAGRPEPKTSIRCTREGTWDAVAALGGKTAVTVMPSTPTSTSARSCRPTVPSAGTKLPATTPLGWRAPAARHVQVPSSRRLVSSMSMRLVMRRLTLLAGGPAREQHFGNPGQQRPRSLQPRCSSAHLLWRAPCARIGDPGRSGQVPRATVPATTVRLRPSSLAR